MTGLNLIIGREAGMSFGYASGFGHAQVVPLNILIETIQVLVIYPLFVQSTRHLIRPRPAWSSSGPWPEVWVIKSADRQAESACQAHWGAWLMVLIL